MLLFSQLLMKLNNDENECAADFAIYDASDLPQSSCWRVIIKIFSNLTAKM
jgi:hypothetical protein